MKISDLKSVKKVNEDTWENLGKWAGNTVKKGINRGLDAVGYHPENTRANKLDTRAKAIGLQMFTKQLTDLLTHAKSSGMLTPSPTMATAPVSVVNKAKSGNPNLPPANTLPTTAHAASISNPNVAAERPGGSTAGIFANRAQITTAYNAAIAKPEASRTSADKKAIKLGQSLQSNPFRESKKIKQYKLFNTLLEYKMLEAEQTTQTTEQFISQFLATQTGKFKDYPTYHSNLKILAQQAGRQFDSTGKINPETMNKMWENLWMWSKMSGGGSTNSNSNVTRSSTSTDDETIDSKRELTAEEVKTILNKNATLDISNYSNKTKMIASVKKLITSLGGNIRKINAAREIPDDKLAEKFQELLNKDSDDDYDKEQILNGLYSIGKTLEIL